MTFIEYLRQKKNIEADKDDIMELMDDYYEEYREFLLKLKDGCGSRED